MKIAMTSSSDESALSSRPRPILLGVVGHVGYDKSSLIAALDLLNRKVEAGEVSGPLLEIVDVQPETNLLEALGQLDVSIPEFTCDRDHRASWKALEEDARRSNRRGRKRRL